MGTSLPLLPSSSAPPAAGFHASASNDGTPLGGGATAVSAFAVLAPSMRQSVAPPSQLNQAGSFRKNSNKKARASLLKIPAQPLLPKPTEVDAVKILQWWRRLQFYSCLRQRKPSAFAAEFVALRDAERKARIEKAKQVLLRFLLHCASRRHEFADSKRFTMLAEVSTRITTMLRALLSSRQVARLREAKQMRVCEVIVKFWKSSRVYQQRQDNQITLDTRQLVEREEMLERRETLRRRALFINEVTDKWFAEPLTRLVLEQRRAEKLRMSRHLALMKRPEDVLSILPSGRKKDSSDVSVGPLTPASASNGCGSVMRLAVKKINQLTSPFDIVSRASSGDTRSKNDSSYAAHGVKRSPRRASLMANEMNAGNGINLNRLLGASPSHRAANMKGGSALAVARGGVERESSMPQGSTHGVSVAPANDSGGGAAVAGLSLFGNDVTNLQNFSQSPLLLEYSRRAGAAVGDRSLADARLQLLNQQLLYPSKTISQPAVHAPKLGVSESFLGEAVSTWFVGADFSKGSFVGRQKVSGALDTRKSVVARKRIGGELLDAQRKLSLPRTRSNRSLSSDDEDNRSVPGLARFSSKRQSFLLTRQSSDYAGVSMEFSSPMSSRHPQGSGGLTLPAGSSLFSIDFEIERLLLQEHSQRTRTVLQSQRIVDDICQQMETERLKDLGDLLPVFADKVVERGGHQEETLFLYGAL